MDFHNDLEISFKNPEVSTLHYVLIDKLLKINVREIVVA